jgi:hypothetical protein
MELLEPEFSFLDPQRTQPMSNALQIVVQKQLATNNVSRMSTDRQVTACLRLCSSVIFSVIWVLPVSEVVFSQPIDTCDVDTRRTEAHAARGLDCIPARQCSHSCSRQSAHSAEWLRDGIGS